MQDSLLVRVNLSLGLGKGLPQALGIDTGGRGQCLAYNSECSLSDDYFLLLKRKNYNSESECHLLVHTLSLLCVTVN